MRLRSEAYGASSSLVGAVHLPADGRLLTTFDEVLCENLHKLEDSQRWEKKKLNKNQITKKKTNNFFDKNKTKNKEFVSLLI